MKKIIPYILISLGFVAFLFLSHREIFSYRINDNLIHDYLRSQDIEDPKGLIKDRIFLSDSDIYIASGYLYATGVDPTQYNFQHPPLVKYLFGYSVHMMGNPYYVQMFFGLMFLFLTYFLAAKIIKNKWLALLPVGFLLLDPVFGGMMEGAYLDLGQAVFALLFVILAIYFPEKFILQGVTLGLFAGSKFWSTAVIITVLIYFYKIFIRKEKLNYKKVILSFAVSFPVFSAIYIKTFIDSGFGFNIFTFLGKNLKFMMTHNSAGQIGGSILLFVTGFFTPWWNSSGQGAVRAGDWSALWPIGLAGSLILLIKSKLKNIESFFYLLPFVYLAAISTGVPFTRYFLIILPFIYLGLTKFIVNLINKQIA